MAVLAVAWMASATRLLADTPSHFVGSITSIDNHTVNVKTDAGAQYAFDVPSDAVIKRIAPGEKDLSKAATIAFSDLAVGDRVLVGSNPTPNTPTPRQRRSLPSKLKTWRRSTRRTVRTGSATASQAW